MPPANARTDTYTLFTMIRGAKYVRASEGISVPGVRLTGLAAARKEFTGDCARVLLDFVATSKRGICADSGRTAEHETDLEEE